MNRVDLPFGRAVRVFWEDSASNPGWQYNPERLGDTAKVVSLGWAVGDKEWLDLCGHISEDGAMHDVLHIPWGAIENLEVLPETWHRTTKKAA